MTDHNEAETPQPWPGQSIRETPEGLMCNWHKALLPCQRCADIPRPSNSPAPLPIGEPSAATSELERLRADVAVRDEQLKEARRLLDADRKQWRNEVDFLRLRIQRLNQTIDELNDVIIENEY